MAFHDDIGNRMKEYYEKVPRIKLVRRMPVAIRLDGKAFHTFTRGFQKPFDDVLIKSMQDTMEYLCRNIQGCVFGYTQSDEITLILQDYKELTTQAWFDYEVQKMCSISASMATMAFNKFFLHNFYDCLPMGGDPKEMIEYCARYSNANDGAMFDSRCFNIPKEEVTNLLYWRQLDAIRNSVQMVGQENFSHKELHGKSCSSIKDMLLEKDINWDELPVHLQRGSCCVKGDLGWTVDLNIPIFKGDGRNYVDKFVFL